MREIAARRDFSDLPAGLVLQLALSLLFVLLVIAAAPFLPNQDAAAVQALRIYCLALFPLAFYTLFTSSLRGMERMNSYALLGLAGVLLQIAAVAIFPSSGIAALAAWLLVVQVLMALLAGIFCTFQIPDYWKAWHFSGRDVPRLARASAPIALLSVLSMLYQKLSIYLISAMGGAALTGWFAGAQRALEASKTAHNSVFTALYPAMARAEPGSGKTLRLARIFLLAGSAVLALGLSFFASPLVVLLLGPDFAPSIPVLRILAWVLVPYTLNTYFTLAFVAARQERRVALALAASLLALVLLNLWWIPRLGLSGAAFAVLAAESFQALILLAQRGFQIRLIAGEKAHEFSKLS
jgi:O-antigen/teichoic acid export membrane protein